MESLQPLSWFKFKSCKLVKKKTLYAFRNESFYKQHFTVHNSYSGSTNETSRRGLKQMPTLSTLMHFVYMSKCHPVLSFCDFTQPCNPQPKRTLILARGTGGSGECFPLEMTSRGLGLGSRIPPTKISGHFHPLKRSYFKSLQCVPPSPVDFVLSTVAPKWAVLTLKLCTPLRVQGSHLLVPPQNVVVQPMSGSSRKLTRNISSPIRSVMSNKLS